MCECLVICYREEAVLLPFTSVSPHVDYVWQQSLKAALINILTLTMDQMNLFHAQEVRVITRICRSPQLQNYFSVFQLIVLVFQAATVIFWFSVIIIKLQVQSS